MVRTAISNSSQVARPWRLAPVLLAGAATVLLALSATAATGSPNPVVWTQRATTTIESVGHADVAPSPEPSTEQPRTNPRVAVPALPTHQPQHSASQRPEPSDRPAPAASPRPFGDRHPPRPAHRRARRPTLKSTSGLPTSGPPGVPRAFTPPRQGGQTLPRTNLLKIGIATAAAAVGATLAITSVFAHSTPSAAGHSVVANIVKAAHAASFPHLPTTPCRTQSQPPRS